MATPRYNRVRLICANPKCINKSNIYRHMDALAEWTCKACGTNLVVSRAKHYVRGRALQERDREREARG